MRRSGGGGGRKLFRLKVMRETTGDVRKSVTGRGRSFDAAYVLLWFLSREEEEILSVVT